MALIALAAVGGIGGAFAAGYKKPHSGTIYYAQKGATGHVTWVTSPTGRCSAYSSLACTITSTSNVSGVQDAFPAQYSLAGSNTTNAVYQ